MKISNRFGIILVTITILAWALITATAALAADAAPAPGIASIVVGWIVTNIFPLIESAIGVTLTALFAKVGIPAIFSAFAMRVAINAVHSMEEKAAVWLNATGKAMESSVKFAGAKAFVSKWTGMTDSDAAGFVNAALGAIPDLGASAKKVETAITGAIAK